MDLKVLESIKHIGLKGLKLLGKEKAGNEIADQERRSPKCKSMI